MTSQRLFQLDPRIHGAAMVVDPVQSTDRRLQDGLAMAASCALVASDSHTSAAGEVFLLCWAVLEWVYEGLHKWGHPQMDGL